MAKSYVIFKVAHKIQSPNALFITFVTPLQPTIAVPTSWIAMCPMNDTTFFIPFVFAAKRDSLADSQIVNAWRQIDVVRNQHGQTARGFNNKTLVPAASVIVR